MSAFNRDAFNNSAFYVGAANEFTVTAETGAHTLTGNDADLSRVFALVANAGVFAIDGQPVTFEAPQRSAGIRGRPVRRKRRRRRMKWPEEWLKEYPLPADKNAPRLNAPSVRSGGIVNGPKLIHVFQLMPRPVHGPRRVTLDHVKAMRLEIEAARERNRLFEEDEDDALAALLLAL